MRIAYRIRMGENLGAVCSRFGVAVDAVRGLNKVVEVHEGQMIIVELAEKRRHRVMPGETADSIAKKYSISRADLMQENETKAIFIGQLLLIP